MGLSFRARTAGKHPYLCVKRSRWGREVRGRVGGGGGREGEEEEFDLRLNHHVKV